VGRVPYCPSILLINAKGILLIVSKSGSRSGAVNPPVNPPVNPQVPATQTPKPTQKTPKPEMTTVVPVQPGGAPDSCTVQFRATTQSKSHIYFLAF